MSDEFQWWRDALAGKHADIHADYPQSGYFRKRAEKGGPWLPVAIWTHKDTGKQVCRVAGAMVNPVDVWTWVADKPVTKESAMAAFKTGAWPGDAPPVASHAIGANNPPHDVVDLIPIEIGAADEWLGQVGTITTQVDSDIASNKVANLRKLKAEADAAHEKEKAPHLAASRAVDARYNPKIKDAAEAVKRLLAAVTVFQNAESARVKKEADARAAKERAEYEAKVAAQRKAAEIEAARNSVPVEEVIAASPLPPPPAPVAAPKIKSGGALGKSVSLRTIKVATITDYDKALVSLKDHPELRELVQKLCDRACKAGVPLAGVEYSTRQEAA